MQARIDNDDDDDDDDGDCIGNTLGKLSRVLSRIREFFMETLNKKFTEFLNVRIFREILHYSLAYWSEFYKAVISCIIT